MTFYAQYVNDSGLRGCVQNSRYKHDIIVQLNTKPASEKQVIDASYQNKKAKNQKLNDLRMQIFNSKEYKDLVYKQLKSDQRRERQIIQDKHQMLQDKYKQHQEINRLQYSTNNGETIQHLQELHDQMKYLDRGVSGRYPEYQSMSQQYVEHEEALKAHADEVDRSSYWTLESPLANQYFKNLSPQVTYRRSTEEQKQKTILKAQTPKNEQKVKKQVHIQLPNPQAQEQPTPELQPQIEFLPPSHTASHFTKESIREQTQEEQSDEAYHNGDLTLADFIDAPNNQKYTPISQQPRDSPKQSVNEIFKTTEDDIHEAVPPKEFAQHGSGNVQSTEFNVRTVRPKQELHSSYNDSVGTQVVSRRSKTAPKPKDDISSDPYFWELMSLKEQTQQILTQMKKDRDSLSYSSESTRSGNNVCASYTNREHPEVQLPNTADGQVQGDTLTMPKAPSSIIHSVQKGTRDDITQQESFLLTTPCQMQSVIRTAPPPDEQNVSNIIEDEKELMKKNILKSVLGTRTRETEGLPAALEPADRISQNEQIKQEVMRRFNVQCVGKHGKSQLHPYGHIQQKQYLNQFVTTHKQRPQDKAEVKEVSSVKYVTELHRKSQDAKRKTQQQFNQECARGQRMKEVYQKYLQQQKERAL